MEPFPSGRRFGKESSPFLDPPLLDPPLLLSMRGGWFGMTLGNARVWALLTALAVAAPCAAFAQAAFPAALPQVDFYRGKQIRLISGHPVGGDYDLGARFLAKHLSRHIPGEPIVVVQNMPAAASVVAAN